MTTSSTTTRPRVSVSSDVVTIAEAAALLRCRPWDAYVKVLGGTLAAEPSCV